VEGPRDRDLATGDSAYDLGVDPIVEATDRLIRAGGGSVPGPHLRRRRQPLDRLDADRLLVTPAGMRR
jgi:hypothetical protein